MAERGVNRKEANRSRLVTLESMKRRSEWGSLDRSLQEAIQVTSLVLPFRTNCYVLEELIDWRRLPHDPIFQLTFPQRGMLDASDYEEIRGALRRGESRTHLAERAAGIRQRLNPHPAGQVTENVPEIDGTRIDGVQHKYRETVLYFPSHGQTCHSYCTYCFRWAQFVGMRHIKFGSKDVADLVYYLRRKPEVSDVLFTGGDPMIMKTATLRRYLEPLLTPKLRHLRNIRIGTKALAFWPQRFVSDPDADELMRLFEEVPKSGRHLSIMVHVSHPVELTTEIARQAVQRVRATGAEIRMQAPVVKHVNDSAGTWIDLWQDGVKLGMVPYFMFVERDTGPRKYFEVPLVRAHEIFREAYSNVSGLARSVRGPSMSTFNGKVRVLGVSNVEGQDVFVLDFLQARDPCWVGRPFFARYDARATWWDQLQPAFDADPFFEWHDARAPSVFDTVDALM